MKNKEMIDATMSVLYDMENKDRFQCAKEYIIKVLNDAPDQSVFTIHSFTNEFEDSMKIAEVCRAMDFVVEDGLLEHKWGIFKVEDGNPTLLGLYDEVEDIPKEYGKGTDLQSIFLRKKGEA